MARIAGLEHVRAHDLRRTAAAPTLSAGTHWNVVSERGATIDITLDTYSHVLPDLQHEAAIMIDTLLARAG